MNVKFIRRKNVLKLIAERFNDNKAAFARAIDRPPPNIHRMLIVPGDSEKDSRGIGEDLARDIEAKMGLGRYALDADLLEAKLTDGNTELGPDITGKVPLISWVQAGEFCETVDLFQPGEAEEWLPAIQALGPHAYALRVKGDSMVDRFGPQSFPEGVIIFVDPDVPVVNGYKVIAKLPDSNEATFKVYSEDAGKRYLKPLNQQFPTIEITERMQLCGVVVGVYNKLI